jgi:NO-binding membrane sensor protein with MHYT domain
MDASEDFKVSWNAATIVLSVGVSFLGSYACITLYEQYRLCTRESKPQVLTPNMLLVMMALSVGGVAIWSMHFIGMSALDLTMPNGEKEDFRYRIDLTVTSLACVLVFSYFGLVVASSDNQFMVDQNDVIANFIKEAENLSADELQKISDKWYVVGKASLSSPWRLLLSGFLLGSGVCVMHYLGMKAIVIDGVIDWNYGIIMASVIIALVAATAAFWILFRLLAIFPYNEVLRIACAAVMAIAVNGMHYTGMAAATWEYRPGKGDDTPMNQTVNGQLAVSIALSASIIFICAMFISSITDIRVWYYNLARIVREADQRLEDAKHGNKEDFIRHYEELRGLDGSEHSIAQFKKKHKCQNVTRRINTSTMQSSQDVSKRIPTPESRFKVNGIFGSFSRTFDDAFKSRNNLYVPDNSNDNTFHNATQNGRQKPTSRNVTSRWKYFGSQHSSRMEITGGSASGASSAAHSQHILLKRMSNRLATEGKPSTASAQSAIAESSQLSGFASGERMPPVPSGCERASAYEDDKDDE